jgi:hypothetical protein
MTAAAFSGTGIPQPAGVNTAEDEGTGTHSTSTSCGHHKAVSAKEKYNEFPMAGSSIT